MKLFLPQLPNVKARSSVLLRERVILRVGGGVSGVLLYSKLSFCCHSNGGMVNFLLLWSTKRAPMESKANKYLGCVCYLCVFVL